MAAAHAGILTRGRRTGRYILARDTASLSEMIDLIRGVTGRRLVRASAPAPIVLGMTAAGEVAQRVLPFRLPFNYGGVWVATHGGAIDASATERDLGVRFRPVNDSIADMLRWLHRAGHLTDRQAGRVAAHTPPQPTGVP